MVFRLQSTTLLPRRRKLQCRNGYFLEVRPDGTVRGTKNNNSIYSELKNWSLTLKLEFQFTKKGRKLESFYQTCHFRKKKKRQNASFIVYSTNVSCNFSGKFKLTCDNGMLDESSLGVDFKQRLLQRQNIANQWPIHKLKCSCRACYNPVKKNREKPSQWLQHKTERSWSGGISFIDVFVFRSL